MPGLAHPCDRDAGVRRSVCAGWRYLACLPGQLCFAMADNALPVTPLDQPPSSLFATQAGPLSIHCRPPNRHGLSIQSKRCEQ